MITKRPVRGGKSTTTTGPGPEEQDLPEISRGGILKTTANTRLTVACLLSRVYDDIISDKEREKFNTQCADFVL